MISEEEATHRFGLSRLTLARARYRELTRGEDWFKDGRKVILTDAGYQKLLTLYEIPINGTAPEATGTSRVAEVDTVQPEGGGENPPRADSLESFVVCARRLPRNTRIVEVTRPGGQEIFRVKVKDNSKFMPGMELRARPDPLYPDVYVLVGRTPRYRGRW